MMALAGIIFGLLILALGLGGWIAWSLCGANDFPHHGDDQR